MSPPQARQAARRAAVRAPVQSAGRRDAARDPRPPRQREGAALRMRDRSPLRSVATDHLAPPQDPAQGRCAQLGAARHVDVLLDRARDPGAYRAVLRGVRVTVDRTVAPRARALESFSQKYDEPPIRASTSPP